MSAWFLDSELSTCYQVETIHATNKKLEREMLASVNLR